MRHAVRVLVARPLSLAAAVLAIGIGARLNVGIYAMLRHVMFDSPLTAAAPDRFMRIEPGISFPNYQELRRLDLPIDLVAMQMNGWPRTIVGVLPKGFAANLAVVSVVYVQIGSHVANALDNRRAAQFDLIGRLRGSVGSREALAALRLAAGQLERDYPEIDRGSALGSRHPLRMPSRCCARYPQDASCSPRR